MLASERNEQIMAVRFTDDELVVALADGRTLSVPLVWYPRLLNASAEQRSDWELIGDGEGIHWPQIDEDLSAAGLLRGVPAYASESYTTAVNQDIKDQTINIAKDFYGNAVGQAKGQLESSRSQLEEYLETLPESQEEARAQIQELLDSYDAIVNSLDEAAQTQGVEDAVQQAVGQVQETTGQAAGQAQEAAGQATGQAQDAAGGAVGQVTGAVGQVADTAQGAAGQATEQVGQVAENLPGGQLLSQTTNEAGQTVQRAVDEGGDLIETTLDEAGNLVDENLLGSVTDLETVEEYQNEEGQTIRTVKEESGGLIRLQLGPDGSILNLAIPKPEEEVTEEVVEESSQSQSGGGEQPDATEAARQRAEEMGVDLSQIEGSGAGGRITVKDVIGAADQ